MTVATIACAGCGKVRPDDAYDHQVVEVEVSVGAFVKICRGRGPGNAAVSCVLRAREDLCPGCGKSLRGDFQSGVSCPVACADCKRHLAKGRDAEARGEKDRKFSQIDVGKFFGVYLGHGDDEKALADALCRAVGGRRRADDGERKQTHGQVPPFDRLKDPFGSAWADAEVEATAEQHQALLDLQRFLAKAAERIRREAFKQGHDLLGKLASGDKSIAEFDDQVTKMRLRDG